MARASAARARSSTWASKPRSSTSRARGTPTRARRSARARTTRASSCAKTPTSRWKSKTACAKRWACRCRPLAWPRRPKNKVAAAGSAGRALGRMTPRPASLKMRALQWLAQREHSRNELRDKLLRLLQDRARRETANATADADADGDGDAADPAAGPSNAPAVEPPCRADAAAEVENLLQWLEAHGYLSQARFVE